MHATTCTRNTTTNRLKKNGKKIHCVFLNAENVLEKSTRTHSIVRVALVLSWEHPERPLGCFFVCYVSVMSTVRENHASCSIGLCVLVVGHEPYDLSFIIHRKSSSQSAESEVRSLKWWYKETAIQHDSS